MKLRITGGVLAFFLFFTVFCGGLTAFAEEKRVYDQAKLFSTDSAMRLDARASTLTDKLEVDFIIVTTDDARGKTPQAYADDFYDDNGFGVGGDKSGVLFLIDMDNREVYISTSGKAIAYLTDTVIDGLLDDSIGYLKQQDYSGAASHFLDRMEKLFPGDDVPAGIETEHIFDQVGLFSLDQVLSLDSSADALEKSLDMALIVVTTDDTGGRDSREYAKEFYEKGGFGKGNDKSGVLFLIDIANRQAAINTAGKSVWLLSEFDIELILDDVVPSLETQDYSGAVASFLQAMQKRVRPTTRYVIDETSVLTDDQLKQLETEAQEICDRTNADIVFIYSDDLQGEDIVNVYSRKSYGRGEMGRAIIYIYNRVDHLVYIQIFGEVIQPQTSESDILLYPFYYIENNDYVSAVRCFWNETEKQVSIKEQAEELKKIQLIVIIGTVLALIGGFIAVQIARSGYKARVEKEEEKQRRGGMLHLTVDEDTLVNTYTTSRYIPPPPPPSSHSGGSSGGGSSSFGGGSSSFGGSTHTSSGGATHGGGGRGF
ncbi:TPM domain-containing protein [Anaeromassilibacillus senegalensis]|uniref:TPM domain-containing protein n=1 Tax=Anaeromassilibacillus senegalensis TaxID=1673717 RepID=UPI000681B5B8|nr:TPM domain-containing protein [Anaeromassilibacillus senegalensis]